MALKEMPRFSGPTEKIAAFIKGTSAVYGGRGRSNVCRLVILTQLDATTLVGLGEQVQIDEVGSMVISLDS